MTYTIRHEVGIAAKPEAIFDALTDVKKLAAWWTSDTRGSAAKVGGIIEFWFGDFCQKFEVMELKPGKLVRWKATKEDDSMDEWFGTEITYSLEPADGQCWLQFSHGGWKSETGMLPHCSHAFDYKGAPMAVVRLNWSTTYCFKWEYHQAVTVPAFRPAEALRLGADVALVSLTLQTGSEETDARNVEVFRELCCEAKELGMPVVGEYFPARAEELSPEELHRKVFMGARIISELGADLIKTFYTNDFKAVTSSCPVPVLGLGAAKLPQGERPGR